MEISDFLTGTRVLEVAESPINGKIEVIQSLVFGKHIRVEVLTQSGGVIIDVWKKTLKKVKSQKSKVKRCLILGLGGGSAAKLVKKIWPEAIITAVELDPKMVELGRKYLRLNEIELNVEIADAFEFCKIQAQRGQKFDLILTDVYVGYEVPKKLESENYIQLVGRLLSESRDSSSRGLARDGIAVFNRLYSKERRPQANEFGKKLGKIFSKVTAVYPEANIMFLCSA